MIITCDNCNKKFDIDSSLIPENGRLLQCSSCDYKWFFKKKIIKEHNKIAKIKPSKSEIKLTDNEAETLINEKLENNEPIRKKSDEIVTDDEFKVSKFKNKKNYSILNLTIVFILSFIGLIIIIDTFQDPISKFVPNIEFLIYNLYQTVNDIILFLKDLI
tara:strand:- start:214 stop:693 length:480 start_codon:yes stop_codon:yes gene_type:complete